MIDKLFFIVLVLNATGLFRFVAPQFDVPIGQVSLVLLVLNVFYLVGKARYSTPLFLRSSMGGWSVVLLFWPLLTISYAPSFEIREIGLLLYHFSLFFGAVVYTVANGLPAMHRVLSVSLVVAIIGLALSMLMPGYFEAVAALADSRTDYMGRAFGFSMQPNRLAVSMGFLSLGWFALWKRKNTLLDVVAILAFLLVMLLTGSRTGILLGVVIVTLHLAHQWRMWWKGRAAFRYSPMKTVVLGICIIGGVVGARAHVHSLESLMDRSEGGLIDRMESLLSGKLSSGGDVMNDVSVQARLDAQVAYWSLVNEEPLLGHGFGSDACYRGDGSISISAHSDALTCAMEYGVLYPIVLGLLLLQLYGKRSRRDVEEVLQTNFICQVVAVVLFVFILTGGLSENRTFYVVWGMLLAIVYFPQYILEYEESAGRISACLSKKKLPSVSAEPSASPPHRWRRNISLRIPM